MTATTNPIPQPPPSRIFGNLRDMDRELPIRGLMRLADQYGPIYRVARPDGRSSLIVSSYELVNEVCDERRFDKLVWQPLLNVRPFTGDGLFTARTEEPNWHKAHNILLPNFGMRAMQGYMPMMIDIAEQLMQKWARLNPDETVDVPADMTRLTLDTIGLCGFDYRFNSFYREEAHPFVGAMVGALGEAMEKGQRLPLQERLMVRNHRRFAENIALMNGIADKLIQERKADPEALATKNDLLNHMLVGIDKASGEGLDDLNIRYQLITFLIAGHETTSGLLSFALYYLLKNPDALQKGRAEVDQVLGDDPRVAPTYAQVNRLKYVGQILKEALRLWPTAPAFALRPYEATTLAGRYPITKDDVAVVLIPQLHRDPAIWGDDAEAFRPERFAPELESGRPINAYKPFGNGQRACIGRQFALQEATLVLGMILQRFDLIDHADYRLKIKQTLTLKPEGFTMKVRPRRRELGAATILERVPAPAIPAAPAPVASAPVADVPRHGTPLLVLHGSNLGTAEGIAEQIAADGRARGFAATVAGLDDYAGRLPREGATIVVSASYNGTPPDNAAKFCAWLRDPATPADACAGVRYAVFGCGDRNWATTYQAIPTLIDRELAAHGAERLFPRGEGDAADDFDGQFRAWYEPFWDGLGAAFGLDLGGQAAPTSGAVYAVEVIGAGAASPFVATYGARPLRILENRELLTPPADGPRSTRHIAVALPAGVTYRVGDHLGVLPRNAPETVARAMRRFGLDAEARIVIRRVAPGRSALPLDQPVAVRELLRDYVELQEVATRAQIAILAAHTECPPHRMHLLALAGDDEASKARYRAEIFANHVSPLDLLERYAACELPFEGFLSMLPPLKPRYYSISSSPRVAAGVATLTVAVVDAPARSGQGHYRGTASNYLREQPEGATIYGFIHAPNLPFTLPADPQAPIIMVGPGTGVAPFRGFLEERAAIQAAGEPVGPALLFFGSRDPDQDFLYETELRDWSARGLTGLVTAFSRVPGQPRVYVQDAIAAHADEVWALLEGGATIYVCGEASRMAPAVRAAFGAIYRERTGADEAQIEAWLTGLETGGRYLADVWAGA